MADSIGIYEFSRQMSRRIAAAEHGSPPLLVMDRWNWVALLVSVELGLQNASAASPLSHDGVAKLASELSRILRTVQWERTVVVITRQRRPVAMLIPAEGPLMEAYRFPESQSLDEVLRQLEETSPSLDEVLDQIRRGAGREKPPK